MNNFHSVSSEKALKICETSTSGLTLSVAKERLLKNGKNALAEKKKKNRFLRFLAQFKDILISVLIVSAIVSVVIGIVEKSYLEFIDAGIIALVVIFNATIGYIQERNSEKAMQSLKNMTKPFCKVIRNGKTIKIKSEELVFGDIVVLEAGDIVPADLRLVRSNSLKIEESALTGESTASEKNAYIELDENVALADRINMAYMGSVVTYGRGSGVVVATGMNTEMGKIATALSELDETTTPLTKRLKSTSLIITFIVLAVCLAVFVYEICLGGTIFSSFSMAIALAVCSIPEGLPACTTVTLSMGMKRLSQQRAIVKSLPAVETLGSTEVICSDKTGTLTLNKMTVKKVFFLSKVCEKLNAEKFENVQDRNFDEIMRCMILCNDTRAKVEDDKLETVGDPTEVALVHYGYKFGLIKENLDGKYQRVNEIPFDSDRKLMSTLNVVNEKEILYTKGAVDNILSRCNRILENGKIRKITVSDKEKIMKINSEFAGEALRNLGFAFRSLDEKFNAKNAEENLIFLGIVGMIDPPREEVYEAIKTCKQAGIRTIMITGDHKDTAFAIAKELGICSDPSKVITGEQLDKISDEQFIKSVNTFSVYARVSPQHKVRIVKALKANDKIVAMTGDGVNDAPSIKAADIGVGMGITGTDVTKEAADIILTDDNFATIVGAVKEGRKIFSNILKILMFLLGTSMAELFALSVILLAFRDSNFFSPCLLLWINFVSDTFVGLALGFERAEKDVMKKKPIKNRGNLFKGEVGLNIISSAVFVSALLIGTYCVCRFALKLSSAEVTTVCFVFLCFLELFHSFNLKRQSASIFSYNPFDNKWLNWGFLASAILTVIVVLIPFAPLQMALGICSISWWQWLLSIGLALLIIPYFEIVKLIIRRYNKRKKNEKE